MVQESQTNILRKFGIELVGAVPWGTHLCQFYESKEDLIGILVPYFSEGLRSNEFCMWVTSPPLEVEEARTALRKAVPDLEEYVRKGQIEIISYDDWYLLGGKFDANRVLQGWVEKENAALKRGFEGLRLTGNTFWIERDLWNSFVDYEEAVNAVIGEHQMIAVCTYCLTNCMGTDVLDVVRNHVGTLIRKEKDWYLVEDMAHRKETEEALVESESQYRSLFANMNSGFAYHKIIQDEDGKPIDYVFLEANDDFAKLTGLKREDILGKRVTEVLPRIEKDPADWIGIYGKVALTGEPVRFENYSQNLKKWYSVSAYSPAKGYFAAAFDDITERKRMEEELRKSRNELEARIKERTADLLKTNERLKEEIEERMRTEQSLRLEEARLDALLKLSQIGEATLREITGFTLEHAIALTNSKIGFVGFLNEDETVYTLHAVSKDVVKECNVKGDPLQWHVVDAGIWADAIREHRTLFVNDYSKPHPRKKGFPPGHPYVKKFMIVPILDGKRIVAIAGVGNKASDYDKSDERQVVLLLKGMWSYIQKAEAEQRIQAELKERKLSEEKLKQIREHLEELVRERTRKLSESEQRWVTTLASIGDAVIATDLNGSVTFMNAVAEELTGWTLKEASQKPIKKVFNIINEQTRQRVEDPVAKVLEKGVIVGLANHSILVRKDGTEVPVDDSGAPIRDAEGNVVGVVLVFRDITERKRTENELRETRDYLENLLNYANAPIIVWDPEFRITKFNHAFERLTGLSSDEAIGKNLDILFPLDKKEESMAHIKRTLEGEYWETVEIPIQHVDGTVKTLLWNSANIYDSSGKEIVATIAQGQDITERKKAEAILREQGVVISSASDAIFSTDNSFAIKSWNKAAERIFGWTTEEAIGKTSISIFNPVYPTLDGTTREQVIEQLMNSGFWKGEIIYHKKDGSPIPVSVSSSRVKGENGSATGVVAVVHDITARKRREEALKEAQRDLNRAQAVAKTGSWRLDVQRNVLLWSDETYRMFGIPKGTPLTYETFLGTVHPEDRVDVDQKWQAALHGEPYDIEHRIIVDGEIKWVREKAELEFDNNGVLQSGFGTVQEITEFVEMREKLEEYSNQMEQLANERAEKLKDAERLAAIGATAGMVGHDIRNPLQAIVGDLYLAKSDLASMPEGEEKEGMKESLREIEANIDYIDKIVQDLQDYARPLKPILQETDFEELCKEVLLKDDIPENIESSYQVKKEAKKVIADPTLLKRILSNLKNNAVQAMPEGGTLEIHAYQDADEVVITVHDTGVGIPEEAKPQLFTPLFTTKSKGQGFGLAVVKRMTEALKGTVTFESKEGKGTKFIIRLPKKEENAE